MKKSSIVFIVFSLVLIIAGVVMCFVAKGMGDVFDGSDTVGEENAPIEITDSVKKIIVKYTDATVNVYGGAKVDRIETVNIDADYIDLNTATEITISDKTDYLSMAFETVTEFSGLRNILFPGKANTGEKTVNIYLSGEYNMTQINITLDNGDVIIKNLDSNTDYGVSVAGEGSITMTDVVTKSNIALSCGTGNVSLSGVKCQHLTGSLDTGNMHCYEDNAGEHHYDLSCKGEGNMIYLLGESQGSTYKAEEAADSARITFTVNNGNIHISKLTEGTE